MVRNMLESTGIKFAPWNIPAERRLQTIASLGWILLMMFGELLSFVLIIYILRSSYYLLGVYYVIRIASQRHTAGLGKYTWKWFRKCAWWQYFRDYFPIKLVKTVDLNPEKNYLFGIFPHGVLSTGCFTCFSTDALDFDKVFPGMRAHMVSLDGHFIVPFFREIPRWLGVVSASAECLNYALNEKNGTGKCVVLVIGGAAESLNCHSGQYKIILSKRKGFVRIAIKNGSPLVPVFSFGETEIYEQVANPEGSTIRYIQDTIRRMTGLAPVIIKGRGIFQYSFGIIPRRHPITTVVGEPIEIRKNPDPTEEEVDAVHAEFVKGLSKLFEDGKSKYLPDYPDARLIID